MSTADVANASKKSQSCPRGHQTQATCCFYKAVANTTRVHGNWGPSALSTRIAQGPLQSMNELAHTQTCPAIHLCTCMQMFRYVYTDTHMHVHACRHAGESVPFIHVCACIQVYLGMHIYMYIQTGMLRCACAYMYVDIHGMHKSMQTYMQASMCMHAIQSCMCTGMQVRSSVTHICTHMKTCALCMCTCTHTHTKFLPPIQRLALSPLFAPGLCVPSQWAGK